MRHNGGVGDLAVTVAQQVEEDSYGLQAGPYALFFFLALIGALVFLLFSMRKQMRRVDFDEDGKTDLERMFGADGRATPPGRHDES